MIFTDEKGGRLASEEKGGVVGKGTREKKGPCYLTVYKQVSWLYIPMNDMKGFMKVVQSTQQLIWCEKEALVHNAYFASNFGNDILGQTAYTFNDIV